MDPKVCLWAAFTAILSGDSYEARERLNDYALWRKAGGFEPYIDTKSIIGLKGDVFQRVLRAQWENQFGEEIILDWDVSNEPHVNNNDTTEGSCHIGNCNHQIHKKILTAEDLFGDQP